MEKNRAAKILGFLILSTFGMILLGLFLGPSSGTALEEPIQGVSSSHLPGFLLETAGGIPPVAGNSLEARDDSYRAEINFPLAVGAPGLLANDRIPIGARARVILVQSPRNGSLALQPDGSFTYTADPDFSGTDRFTYRLVDGIRESEVAEVTIIVPELKPEPEQVSISAEQTAEPLAFTGPVIAPITDFSETVDGVPLYWEKAYYQDLDIAANTPLEIPFGLNHPSGYDPAGTSRYPLVVYLHGASGRSDWTISNSDPDQRDHSLVDVALIRPTARYFAKAAQTQPPYLAFVLAPQVPSWSSLWVGTGPDIPYTQTDTPDNTYSEYMHLLENLLFFLKDSANEGSLASVLGLDPRDIDTSRIYVVGDSDGAKGTWDILGRQPSLFAGGIAASGTGPANRLSELRQTPLWTIHGKVDDVVINELPSQSLPLGSGTLGMLSLLDPSFDNTASTSLVYKDNRTLSADDPQPSDSLIYTEFEETFNHSGVAVYWTGRTSGTLPWLFAQTRGTASNSPPVAEDQAVSTTKDTAVAITLTASDSDNDPLTYTIVTEPSGGTLSGTAPEVTYTPASGFTGTDTFTFNVDDGTEESNLATVTITVTEVSLTTVPDIEGQAQADAEEAIVAAGLLVGNVDTEYSDSVPSGSVISQEPPGGTVVGEGSTVDLVISLGNADAFLLFGDGFSRPDAAALGNGWIEVEGSGATVGVSGGRLTFTDTSDQTNRPMALHDFSRISSGRLTWDFDFDWARIGNEGVYRLFMQLGDGSLMSNSSQDSGIGVNLLWSKFGDNHETLGYRRGGIATPLTQVSGAAHIRVEADLDLHTYTVAVDGTTVASGIPFDRLVDLDTVRFFTDSLNEIPFSGRSFDNLEIRRPSDSGNTPPVAGDDVYSTNEDTLLAVAAPGVLGNDTDIEGDPVTAILVAPASDGSVELQSDGSFIYTPKDDFWGTDSFSYKANDGLSGGNVATVTLTVHSVNDGPIAVDDAATTSPDIAAIIDVLLNDTDVDLDPLSVQSVTQGASGAVINNGSNVTYTPGSGFIGMDSFQYTVSDGEGGSATATVTVAVETGTTLFGDPFSRPDDTVLGNGWIEVEGSGATVGVSGGRLTFTDTSDQTNRPMALHDFSRISSGRLTWDFDFDWARTGNEGKYWLFMQLGDGSLMSNSSQDEGIGVNLIWTKFGGNQETLGYRREGSDTPLTQVSGSAHIQVEADLDLHTFAVAVDGTIVASGIPFDRLVDLDTVRFFTDSLNEIPFSGRSFDNLEISRPAGSGNTPPVARDDSYGTEEDTLLAVPAPGVLGNDTDNEGGSLSALLVTPADNGTVILNPDGSFSYTPKADFWGIDSFSYRANDGFSGGNVATVTLTIHSVNDGPEANDDIVTASPDTAVNIDVLGNDTDVDLDPLSVQSVTQGASGAVINNGGDVTYTPDSGFIGMDSFQYTVSDGQGESATATVTVTVETGTTLFGDAFSRPDDTVLGNGWIEVEGSGATVGVSGGRLTFTDTSDQTNRPMALHDFSRISSGRITWDFDFDWTRIGNEGVYRLFMQLGDGSLMSNSNQDGGVGVNLIWTKFGDNHETLGYRQGGVGTPLTQVSGAAHIRVEADLNAHTYAVTVDGTNVASGIPFDRLVDLDTVRFFTDSLNEIPFSGRSFDNLELRRLP